MKNKPKINLCVILFAVLVLGSPISPAFAASDLDDGVAELATKISKTLTDNQRRKVAVIEFSDLDGNVSAFGQYLAEKLITALFMDNQGKIEVVERRQLMKVLSEQKLTMSGLLDASAMKNVGQILGIDAIVTGAITDLGNQVDVNARLIGVDTAKIFAVAATKIPKVGTVKELIEKMSAPTQVFAAPSPGTANSGRSGSSISTIPQTKTGTPFQDLEKIRVEVKSIQPIGDTKASVSLTYINKTKETLYLVIPYRGCCGSGALIYTSIYLTDNEGTEYRLIQSGGIATLGQIKDEGGAPLVIQPGNQATISFLFSTSNKKTQKTGAIFAIAIENGYLAVDKNGDFIVDSRNNMVVLKSVFNISIQGIKP